MFVTNMFWENLGGPVASQIWVSQIFPLHIIYQYTATGDEISTSRRRYA